ncbi:hypothetical protein ABB26_10760 [Stenotrophomonas humi]|uniref:Uncharacterized protein n=2 Tax=Stenotrophomonas humi TaxID=405444 RepID=A0A0R0CBS8_9GAMM|nr:hypothetical protein ABB26_10760 [Stenotrophomonas humi]
MKGSKAFVLLFGALLCASGTVSGSNANAPVAQSGEVDFHTPLLQRARELAATGKPLELFVASRLALPTELSAAARGSAAPSQSEAWMEQAIRVGSDQPVIARAAVSRCIEGGRCDIPVAIQTLRTREADDVVAQLLLWRMAVAQGDAQEAARAWTRATQANRFVDEYAEGLGLLDRMTQGMQLPADAAEPAIDPDTPRQIMVYALAASWIPVLTPFHRECPATEGGERKEGCLHLAAMMADSSSALFSSFGISKLGGYAEDETARKRWQERKRQLYWTIERAMALQEEGSNGLPADSQDYMRWISESGELPAMRRLLAVHGVAALPPDDWQPSVMGWK